MTKPFLKKFAVIVLLLVVATGLVACGGGDEAEPTVAPTEAVAPTEVPTEPAAEATEPPAEQPTAVEASTEMTTTETGTDSAAMTATEGMTETETVTAATEVTAAEAMTATEALTATESSTETSAAPASETASSEPQIFVIDQSQSEARFTLDEMLMGAPKTVVGTTKLVSGEITIVPSDASQTAIGPIEIDARDFTTDSGMRNRAIQNFVLQSSNDEFRYITFAPTAVDGLPASAAPGDTFEVSITGDLTISGVTKPVTFATNIIVDSETQISGLATTQVLRSDYNLTIPNVPSVADVTDEVALELEFVAVAQS